MILFPETAFATEVDSTCAGSTHCYATRSQGMSIARVPPGTVYNISSVTVTLRSHCQDPYDFASDIIDTEFWVGTPPHAGNTTEYEWVEMGITSGTLNGATAFLYFYWARGWFDPSSLTNRYQEFRIGTSTAALDTNYQWTIKYVPGSGSGTGWRIFDSTGNRGGGSANNPPGVGQWIEVGAESSILFDGNVGSTSGISWIHNGSTTTGLTGYVFRDTDAYTYTSTGYSNISFETPSAIDPSCR
jgi:hypothetical protein